MFTLAQAASLLIIFFTETMRKPIQNIINTTIIILPEYFWYTAMVIHYYYFSYKYITITGAKNCGRLYWLAYMNTTDYEDPIIVENYKTLRLFSERAHIVIHSDYANVECNGEIFSTLPDPRKGNVVVLNLV